MCLLMFKICEKLDIFHEISIYRRSSPIRDHPLTLVIVKILQQDSRNNLEADSDRCDM